MLQQAVVNYSLHNCSRMAAALAYYALFSIFPLLLVLLSLVGVALQFMQIAIDARTFVFDFLASNTSREIADWLDNRLTEIQDLRGTAGLVGALALFFAASGVFTVLDDAFNEIWGLPVPEHGPLQAVLLVMRRRFFAFLVVLSLGVLTVFMLILSSMLRTLATLTVDVPYSAPFWALIGLLVVPLLNWFVLMLMFKIMPDTHVAWGDVWLAAGVTVLLLEGAKRMFTWYINAFGIANAYGAIGNVVVFVLLIYVAAQIVFLGGELSAAYARTFGSRATEGLPVPKPAPLPPTPTRRAWLRRRTAPDAERNP
jgi:membrane protein